LWEEAPKSTELTKKWALHLLDTQMANFMWNDEEGNHKINLANWPSICMKKGFWRFGDSQPTRFKHLPNWILDQKIHPE
jgi:hypothetical protein